MRGVRAVSERCHCALNVKVDSSGPGNTGDLELVELKHSNDTAVTARCHYCTALSYLITYRTGLKANYA